jgi:Meiotically Up-regulated Gene 113 (MUG113) protein
VAYYEYLYFVQMLPDGPIKIGRAANPEKRLRALQTASPFDLAVRALIKSCRPGQDESSIHHDLAEWRIRGEWFDADPAVLEFIDRADELQEQLRLRDIDGNDRDRWILIGNFRDRTYADWAYEAELFEKPGALVGCLRERTAT